MRKLTRGAFTVAGLLAVLSGTPRPTVGGVTMDNLDQPIGFPDHAAVGHLL
jgi:hypothetical protein